MFNVIHNQWIIKADFIVRKYQPYREVEFARRRKLQLEGKTIFVVAPEDLILSKLICSRESNCEAHKMDAQNIAKSANDLDWAYLKKWAETLGLQDLLSARKYA